MFAKICFILAVVCLNLNSAYSAHPQSEEPLVKRALPAIYPPLAVVAEESGTVVVEVRVNPEGTVSEATAIEGHKLFRTTAESSARRWVFNAVGQQESRVTRLTFSFKFIKRPMGPEDLLCVFMPPYSVEIRSTAAPYVIHKNVDPANRPAKRKAAPKRS